VFDRTQRFWGVFFVYNYTDRCLLLSNFSTSGLACGLMVSLQAYNYKFAGLIPAAPTDVASIHLTNYLNIPVLPTPEKAFLVLHVCCSLIEHRF
jgi:hypothetical protein